MPEAEQNPSERLTRETTIGLTKQSVAEAHEQNPNALGVVIHGSRANKELGNILWRHVGLKYMTSVNNIIPGTFKFV